MTCVAAGGRRALLGIAVAATVCGSCASRSPELPEPIVPPLPVEGCEVRVLVAFDSRDGSTERMAESVAAGAATVSGALVERRRVSEVAEATLLASHAVLLGSPVYNGNVTPEVQAFINGWPFEGRPLADRVGAAFVSAGGISAGEEAALQAIHRAMLVFGMVVVGGDDWRSAFGASAIVDEPPFGGGDALDPRFLDKAHALGARVAGFALAHYCGAPELGDR